MMYVVGIEQCFNKYQISEQSTLISISSIQFLNQPTSLSNKCKVKDLNPTETDNLLVLWYSLKKMPSILGLVLSSTTSPNNRQLNKNKQIVAERFKHYLSSGQISLFTSSLARINSQKCIQELRSLNFALLTIKTYP